MISGKLTQELQIPFSTSFLCHDWIFFLFVFVTDIILSVPPYVIAESSFLVCSLWIVLSGGFFFFLFNMFVNCLWIVIARYFHSFLFLIHSNLLPYPLPWVNSNFWVTFCGVSLWLLGKDVTFLLVGRSSLGKVWVFNRAVNRPSILFFGSKRTLNLLYKTSGYLLPNSPVLATEAYCCLTTT